MKSVWDGSIAFGLVNIPVSLYTAKEPVAISFRMLHDKCNTHLHYRRFCEKCGKEVKWQNVVKGFELAKDKYYVLTPEKLEKLKPEKSAFIEILAFIDSKIIDPLLFEHYYYVAPQKPKEKAYFLLKDVLAETAKAAIGRIILREKEYICLIESYKTGMLLVTLSYAYELRDINKIEKLGQAPKISKEEMGLARELITRLSKKEFDISKFKDQFAEKLKAMILKEIKGEKIIVSKAEKPKKATLMQALKASIR